MMMFTVANRRQDRHAKLPPLQMYLSVCVQLEPLEDMNYDNYTKRKWQPFSKAPNKVPRGSRAKHLPVLQALNALALGREKAAIVNGHL